MDMDERGWPSVRPYKQRRLGWPQALTSEMRAASFRAPYLSLAKFALSLTRTRRSRSEPTIKARRSDVVLAPQPAERPSDVVPCSQPPTQDPRAPSPAPTEIVEPESEHILENLKSHNIKVRDFAYPCPSSRPLPPVAELFDPYKAIAEYEYRLRMTPHISVPGKTMRRLLSVGWVPHAEAQARLRPIDWEAMREYDQRNTGYPYRTMKWSDVPTKQQREALFENGVRFFEYLDRVQAELRMEEEWREQERLRGEEAGERVERRLEEIRERERRKMEVQVEAARSREKAEGGNPIDTPPPMAGKKRALERSPSPSPSTTPAASTTNAPKRIKLSRDSDSRPPQPPASPNQHHHQHHHQQHPAQRPSTRLHPHPPVIVPSGHATPTPPASDDDSDYPPL
ncbi:hypothetical protein C0992_011294, partial [Termitomyces sp. T32_za158]